MQQVKDKGTPFHGETRCQKCERRAYYGVRGQGYLCGAHSRKYQHIRKEMKKRPKAELDKMAKEKLDREMVVVQAEEKTNHEAGKRGQLVLDRLKGRFGKPQDMAGFQKIFPNHKHQHRNDGFGCKSLSPKVMGPVLHSQPGLPPAKNLENLHQSQKLFDSELDGKGNPKSVFYSTRLAMYNDPEPHRHKEASKGKNQCRYSIWVDKSGKEIRLSYVESRQIYCHYYELFAWKDPNFKQLLAWHKAGRNLQISGYDAFPMKPDLASINQAYLDPSAPFGHERVLMTMLALHDGPELFPWRVHRSLEF